MANRLNGIDPLREPNGFLSPSPQQLLKDEELSNGGGKKPYPIEDYMGTSLGTDCPQMALLRGEAFSLPFHQRHFSLANNVVLGTKPSRNTPCKELSWVQPAMDPASFHMQHRGLTPSHLPLSEGVRVAKTSRHPPEPAAKRKDKTLRQVHQVKSSLTGLILS